MKKNRTALKTMASLLMAIGMLAALLATPVMIFADDSQPGGDGTTQETQPAEEATEEPTAIPTVVPTATATDVPTEIPTAVPTEATVSTEVPTEEVQATPTVVPDEGQISAQAFSIISPVSDAILYTKQPTFRWNADSGATYYQIYVYRITIDGITKKYDKTVSSSVCSSGVCSSTPSTSLDYGKYQWKIRSYNGGAWGAFSEYGYFTLVSSVPVLKTPATTIYVNEPTFTWSEITDATQYQIQVYNSSSKKVIDMITTDFTCSDSICSVTATKSLSNGAYKWRIRTYYNGSWRSYSSYKSFKVAGDFTSQFNSSSTGWSKVAGGTWSLYGNKYYITSGATGKMTSARYTYIYDDLDYEVYMKREGTAINGSYPANYLCVRMGASTGTENLWYSGYVFGYTNMGNYSIWRISKTGGVTAIQPWTDTDTINAGDWNLLRVVADGDSFEFYINDTLVNSFTDDLLTRGYVGVQMFRPSSGVSKLYLDYADLTVLNAESLSAASVSNVTISEKQQELNREALNSVAVGSIDGYPE